LARRFKLKKLSRFEKITGFLHRAGLTTVCWPVRLLLEGRFDRRHVTGQVVGDSIIIVRRLGVRSCLSTYQKEVANTIFDNSAGDIFIYIMTKLEIDPTNILPISLEDLDEEQRREIEQHLKATQEALLAGCFINTRQGVVGKPGSTPKVTVMR
jgi:hypothetical protein